MTLTIKSLALQLRTLVTSCNCFGMDAFSGWAYKVRGQPSFDAMRAEDGAQGAFTTEPKFRPRAQRRLRHPAKYRAPLHST